MNKAKIIFSRVIPIVFILMIVVSTNVLAFGSFDVSQVENIETGTESIESADVAVGKVWNTVVLILQILAVAAVVFAGVRYMFASADGKADIKKQSIGLIVGAILVFGATFVINFIVDITEEVTNTGSAIVETIENA